MTEIIPKWFKIKFECTMNFMNFEFTCTCDLSEINEKFYVWLGDRNT